MKAKKVLDRISGILAILSGIFSSILSVLVFILITAFKEVFNAISLKYNGTITDNGITLDLFFALFIIMSFVLIVSGVFMVKRIKIIDGVTKNYIVPKIIFFVISTAFIVFILFLEFSYIYILFFALVVAVILEIISLCLKDKNNTNLLESKK